MKSQRCFSEVSVVLCLVTMSSQVLANPVGESLRAGRARFDRSAPGSLSIHQDSDRLIINWREFSIAAGETTRFIQPSATSIALNRVVTANPSRLFGNLEANGKVYLINPNGILVGPGGAVNTRGFVASTLDVSDASFLSSAKLRLSGDSEASVINEGSIQAIGGNVFLVGRTVENSGAIRAGTVGLGAGSEVMIVPTGRERLSVIAGNPNGGQAGKGVNNEGTIEAVSAELKAAGGNIYALAINNGGIIRATGVRREGGRVFLSSDGGDIENSGVIVANNANGSGGFVSLAGGHNEASPATVINSGVIEARGVADGSVGGRVRLTGDYVGLFGASVIDVSGQAGGGTALIGGDYHGGNLSVQNAVRTFVGPDSQIRADALSRGNGGRVIVWADDVTRFFGSISARGGASAGNGGFAEVSGHNSLVYRGRADLRSPLGHVGDLLLDPKTITIDSAGTDPADSASNEFADNAAATATIKPADLVTALDAADVILQANSDITFNDDVDESANLNVHNLTLQAGRSITLGNNVDITLRGSFSATFNDGAADSSNRDPGQATFTMNAGSTITARAGVSIQGGTLAADSGGATSVSANTGDIQITTITTAGAAALNGNPGNAGGNITIANNAASGKNLSVSGNLDASGSDGNGSGGAPDQNGGSGGTININATGTVSLDDVNTTGGADAGTAVGGNAGSITVVGGGNVTLNRPLLASGGSGNTAGSGAPISVTSGATLDTTEPGGTTWDIDAGDSTVFLSASSLTVAGEVRGLGGITFTADTLDITAMSDMIDAGSSGFLVDTLSNGRQIDLGTETGGKLSVTATELANVTAGTYTFGNASSGAIAISDDFNFGGANLNLISGGDIAFGNGDTLTSAGATVNLTSGGAITSAGGGANIVAASLSATAQTGIGLDTTITTLTLAEVLGTGAINISDTAGGLAVTTATTADGDITLHAAGGDLTVTTVTANGTGADVQLSTTVSGDVTVGAVTAAGDVVTINSFGAIFDGNFGAVNIVADSLSTTAGAGIDLDTDITTLTLATAGGAGNIDINDTAGDLAVGVVTALSSDVTLTSAGAITDANGAAANVAAGTLSVTAQSGIDLDTTIATLTLANVLGIGAINISDTAGGLAVTTATTADGDITLNATLGDLSVTTVTAGGTGADVQLSTTTSGDVNVGAVTAAGDSVTITSAGAITDGNGATVNIVADSLSVTAQNDIDLDTTITTLTLASVLGTGNINIADTDGLIVTSATTATGGDIALSATGGDLDVTTANAGGNGDIQLTTTTSGNVNVGTVTATGDDVTITSAGAITDANGAAANVIASTLSATAQTGIELDTTITTLTLANVLAAGTINIADTDGLAVTTATTFDGNITLSATGGTLDVTTVTANGAGADVQLTTTTSGNVNLGAVTANDSVTITSAGAITDGNGAAVNIVAGSLTATATSFGASGNPIETSVDSLDINTSTAGGDQFITEANGLTALNLNAGAGDVDLTVTLGAVTDADAATDITAGDLTVTLSDAAAQNFGASAAQRIQTSVNTLSVDTSAGDGSQYIAEASALTGLNLNADGGSVDLTAGGTVTDTDASTDIDASGISVFLTGNGAIGTGITPATPNGPIKIDAGPGAVTLDARGVGGSVHVELAQAGNVTVTDSGPYISPSFYALFNQNLATIFTARYVSDFTIKANGNIASTMSAGTALIVPGTLTLNAVGVGSSIGGGIANPFAIDAGTLNASAGTGLSFSEAGDVTLGNISSTGGPFFIEALNTLTFNGATVINAGVGGTAFLVANGVPGVSVVGTPTMTSRFLLYALNAALTDPPVIINNLGIPSIGLLNADAIDSPRNFNPATPDPFGDLLNYFVFSLEANPPIDPSLFIDIPVEVFQPVSIVFGDYDPTKFGEVGDLWMSSSELYEIERKAGKARKALPVQVNRSKYTPPGN